MQSQSRLLDELARLVMTAAGAAQGAAREAETLARSRIERLLADLDLVSRDEFDAMKALAQAARAENHALSQRVAALEAAAKGANHSPGRPVRPNLAKNSKVVRAPRPLRRG